MGQVQFDKMIIENKSIDTDRITYIPIKRLNVNKKQRPEEEMRYADSVRKKMTKDNLNLINEKDLEWLSWNWRAW